MQHYIGNNISPMQKRKGKYDYFSVQTTKKY